MAKKKPQVRVRGVYGAPLSQKLGQKIPLTGTQLNKAAKIILRELRKEIRREISKLVPRKAGEPVPIPDSPKFVKSFKVRIRGQSTIEITSNWPTAAAHLTEKKSGPYPMTWLNRSQVPYAKLSLKDGTVVVRTTPLSGGKMWIHPGFKKYGFLNKGIGRGKEEALKALALEILQNALDSEVSVG